MRLNTKTPEIKRSKTLLSHTLIKSVLFISFYFIMKTAEIQKICLSLKTMDRRHFIYFLAF
jgi:hypothetical protein